MKWHVGQRVYCTWRNCYVHSGSEEVIVRVGRKWAYIEKGYRFDDSGYMDGGEYSSPGKVWESEAEYDKWCAR